MGTKVNLLGMKFGKLTAVSETGKNSHGKITWKYVCDCGNTATVNGTALRKKQATKSCGCLKKTAFIDLTVQSFNNLKIDRYVGKENSNNI